MLEGLAVAPVIPTTVLVTVVVAVFTQVVELFDPVTVYVVEPAVVRLK